MLRVVARRSGIGFRVPAVSSKNRAFEPYAHNSARHVTSCMFMVQAIYSWSGRSYYNDRVIDESHMTKDKRKISNNANKNGIPGKPGCRIQLYRFGADASKLPMRVLARACPCSAVRRCHHVPRGAVCCAMIAEAILVYVYYMHMFNVVDWIFISV